MMHAIVLVAFLAAQGEAETLEGDIVDDVTMMAVGGGFLAVASSSAVGTILGSAAATVGAVAASNSLGPDAAGYAFAAAGGTFVAGAVLTGAFAAIGGLLMYGGRTGLEEDLARFRRPSRTSTRTETDAGRERTAPTPRVEALRESEAAERALIKRRKRERRDAEKREWEESSRRRVAPVDTEETEEPRADDADAGVVDDDGGVRD